MRNRKKPIIFWLFAMTDSERNSVINCTDDFSCAGVKFITVDFIQEQNSFKVSIYNLTESESKDYIDDIYKKISQHYNIGEVETRV